MPGMRYGPTTGSRRVRDDLRALVDRLLVEFPELPAGSVVRAVVRARLHLVAMRIDDEVDAVEVLTRSRLIELSTGRTRGPA
jgi:hypothetical protein